MIAKDRKDAAANEDRNDVNAAAGPSDPADTANVVGPASTTLTTAGVAAAIALLAVALAVRLMLFGGFLGRVLGVRLRITDVERPLFAGAVLAVTALWLGRRSRAFRALGGALLVCVGFLAIVAVARHAAPMTPGGDVAVIESYTLHALRGELLLGPYSRYPWHHPGPLSFFVFAPAYILSGYNTSGLVAGAVALNIASIAVLVWVMARGGAGLLAVLSLVACLAFSYRAAALFGSAWNPHVLILPTLALVAVSAGLAAGRLGLMPLCVFFASFAAQTHVGLLPLAAIMAGVAIVTAGIAVYFTGSAAERERLRRTLNRSAWFALFLWWLPLAEQAIESPGNLTRLWQFFVEQHGGQPFTHAVTAWGDMLSGMLRPDFYVALGGVYRPSAASWAPAVSLIQVGLLVWAALHARARHATFQAAYCTLLLLASLIAFWSTARIEGEIADHQIFWLSAIGALNLGAIAERIFVALARPDFVVPRPVLVGANALLLTMVAAIGLSQLRMVNAGSRAPGDEDVAVQTLADAIRLYLVAGGHGKPTIQIDQPAWKVAAGVILQMQKAAVPFAVGRGAIGMFNNALAETGDESLEITISAERNHARMLERVPGIVTIAGRRGYYAETTAVAR